ncbi:deoxyribodipyrimidine photo-lyase [Pokkaliibacter sp. CJK22405]|uniref:deoxyribodipyrimidine photo-lyase n=1 Tax=Pokkaliibacter sp. CJK22405 TaxID=3384615 RepID=UPI0039850F17
MHLVWFRQDLRIHDHSALWHACREARKNDQPVVAVVAITPKQWAQHDDAPVKQSLYYRSLECLSSALNSLNIPLKIINSDFYTGLPDQFKSLCEDLKVSDFHFHYSYEINERQCEKAIVSALDELEVRSKGYTDQIYYEPGSILTGQGDYYTVFTPFKKNLWPRLMDDTPVVHHAPSAQAKTHINSDPLHFWLDEHIREDLWPAGEDEASQRLHRFTEQKLGYYEDKRDFPAIAGTSTLSPYLALGMISPRQCLRSAMSLLGEARSAKGAETWISELIWREFYKHILVGFPRVSRHKPFKEDTDNLHWRTSEKELKRWQQGETGYPLVDAAMKQLLQTGWMHNRLRMVSAMFLTKHLLIDWRLGEQWFMQHLVDGDLSANNGGWQWSASTGTDAAPYFRIFNPVTQSERFDKDGQFIKRFLPALKPLSGKELHAPWKSKTPPNEYPAPIVEHGFARQRALDAFKNL